MVQSIEIPDRQEMMKDFEEAVYEMFLQADDAGLAILGKTICTRDEIVNKSHRFLGIRYHSKYLNSDVGATTFGKFIAQYDYLQLSANDLIDIFTEQNPCISDIKEVLELNDSVSVYFLSSQYLKHIFLYKNNRIGNDSLPFYFSKSREGADILLARDLSESLYHPLSRRYQRYLKLPEFQDTLNVIKNVHRNYLMSKGRVLNPKQGFTVQIHSSSSPFLQRSHPFWTF